MSRPAAPIVSVVLPARDAAEGIARAVASIQRQTFSDWELIMVEDGSTDATAGIAAALAREDPRIRLQRQPPQGIVAALNAGIARARGQFIARMDADDESLPRRLAAQVDFLRTPANAGIDLVGCLVDFAGDPASAGYALHVDWLNSLTSPEAIALNRFVESPFAHPSVLFRRELVERHGGYRDGDFPEDYELWLRWLDAGVRMAKVPETLLRWSDPPTRLSRVDARYRPDAFFALKAKWIAREVVGRGRLIPPLVPDESSVRRGPATPPDRRPVFIWGAGRPTRKRAAALAEHGVAIAGYIDVDAKKVTPALGGTGAPVLSLAEIPSPENAFILGYVASRGARELIRGELRARGYVEGRDFLMCA